MTIPFVHWSYRVRIVMPCIHRNAARCEPQKISTERDECREVHWDLRGPPSPCPQSPSVHPTAARYRALSGAVPHRSATRPQRTLPSPGVPVRHSSIAARQQPGVCLLVVGEPPDSHCASQSYKGRIFDPISGFLHVCAHARQRVRSSASQVGLLA
jgi:hypothetical protein